MLVFMLVFHYFFSLVHLTALANLLICLMHFCVIHGTALRCSCNELYTVYSGKYFNDVTGLSAVHKPVLYMENMAYFVARNDYNIVSEMSLQMSTLLKQNTLIELVFTTGICRILLLLALLFCCIVKMSLNANTRCTIDLSVIVANMVVVLLCVSVQV